MAVFGLGGESSEDGVGEFKSTVMAGNEGESGLWSVVEVGWELSEVDSSRGLDGNMGAGPGVGDDGSDAIYV